MKSFFGINPLCLFAAILFPFILLFSQKQPVGKFKRYGDIGDVLKKGSVTFDSVNMKYIVTGGGENIWTGNDEFYYVWKKAEGDISIASEISFPDTGGSAHRKAGLMFRQSLEPDAPYADVILHGNGLASLQYREVKGGPTHEIQSLLWNPKGIKIQKEGDYVFMYVASGNGKYNYSGASYKIKFEEPFYAGLAVCAHDKSGLEKAVFSNVEITAGSKPAAGGESVEATLETISIDSKDRKVVNITPNYIEGAFWSGNGKDIFFTNKGQLYRVPAGGGSPVLFYTGKLNEIGSSNGLSPDKKQLAISNYIGEHQSVIYTESAEGGEPKLICPVSSSWWHSWSPDGSTILFTGMRNNNLDIYSLPVSGGKEKRLTTQAGTDDGAEFSPDGKYIYFNSDRSGLSQIWRMKPDGSSPEQITFDEYNNWFPHVSPDGKWIVFLSYKKDVKNHPANQDVMLRLLPTAGGEIEVLTKLYGGQGTFDVNSWAPDSKSIAFISFRVIH